MKKTLREFFRDWDEDRFDPDAPVAPALPSETEPEKTYSLMEDLKDREIRRFYRVTPVFTFVLAVMLCLFLGMTVLQLPAFGSPDSPVLNEVFTRYIENGTAETGAVNSVAGVILDYRAFDTLGESHVLYAAMTAVLILLLGAEAPDPSNRSPGYDVISRDPILTVSASVVVPVVTVFGLYIVFNGHLGPGGGFSGGSVIGAALILSALAFGFGSVGRFLNLRTFRTVTASALCFYSLSKCYSFFCGANGIESGIGPGVPGRILSAGLILPLNAAVGIIVACTMYGLYSIFRRGYI